MLAPVPGITAGGRGGRVGWGLGAGRWGVGGGYVQVALARSQPINCPATQLCLLPCSPSRLVVPPSWQAGAAGGRQRHHSGHPLLGAQQLGRPEVRCLCTRLGSQSTHVLGAQYSLPAQAGQLTRVRVALALCRACVAALRPRRLIPTVNAGDAAKRRAIVDRFADLMDLSGDRSRIPGYFLRKAAALKEALAEADAVEAPAQERLQEAKQQQQAGQRQDNCSAGSPQQRLYAEQQGWAAQLHGADSCKDGCRAGGGAGGAALGPCAADTGWDGDRGDSSGGGLSPSRAVDCADAAAGSVAAEQARGRERPPAAPRLGCTQGPATLPSVGSPADEAAAAAGEGSASCAAAAPRCASDRAAQGGAQNAEDIDLASVDVAEQQRILNYIQSQAARSGSSRASSTPGRSGGGGGQAGCRKRAGSSGGGLCQPSLKRFFSPSRGS